MFSEKTSRLSSFIRRGSGILLKATHTSGSRGSLGASPLTPKIFFSKSCSFQAIVRKTPILSKFWAQAPPPWGQNSAGPPDQNPRAAPGPGLDLKTRSLQAVGTQLQFCAPKLPLPQFWYFLLPKCTNGTMEQTVLDGNETSDPFTSSVCSPFQCLFKFGQVKQGLPSGKNQAKHRNSTIFLEMKLK